MIKKRYVVTGAIVNGDLEVLQENFFGSGAVSKEYIKTKKQDFIKANIMFKGHIS